ncbi:MAG TPA: DUF2231 domain-containing protein [Polyangiales bacterium]|nr:DUF2231 domain-containing protein [Polyangiales bacterium]
MESRAKLLGHPVHQMLIPIPAGLFIVAAVLDVVDKFADAAWIPTVTFWNLVVGVLSALVAAIFGLADFTKIPNHTRAKRIGALHGVGNVLAVAIFGLAIYLRSDELSYQAGSDALTFEIIGFVLLSLTGWLGGELVDRLGVGVDEGAHVNAPSSLSAKHVPHARH